MFDEHIRYLRERVNTRNVEQRNYWVGAGVSITPPNHPYQRESACQVHCHMMLARKLSWLFQVLYYDVFDGQIDFSNKFEWAYRLARTINHKLEQPDVSDEEVMLAVLDEAVLVKVGREESIQTYYANQQNLLGCTEEFVRRL